MAAWGNRYFGALVLVAAIIPLPFLAALITIIAYLSPTSPPAGAFFDSLGPSNMVILLGLIIIIVLWLLLAIPCMRFATAKGARPSDYESLQRGYVVLSREFKRQRNLIQTEDIAEDIAFVDIQANLKGIDKILKCDGLTWLSTGYVSLWDRINEADEAIVDVLHSEKVIESAKFEELRLKNSLVPDRENLLNILGQAIKTLSSDSKGSGPSAEQNQDTNLQQSMAKAMLALLEEDIDSSTRSASTEEPQPGSHQQDKANKLQQYMAQAMLALLKKATDNGQVSQQTVQEARADIRKVKAALHKFTNERWDGLVRARNQLMGTAFLTAGFTYILVIIAVLANVRPLQILEAMVYFFLGAIVGLFGRLFDERNADTVIDDYGLSMARIIVTPLLSGLAALVGVLLATTLAISIGSTTSMQVVTIYGSLTISLQNLVFAAVFGYVPNLVITMLQSKSEEIKGQIKSANPSAQKSGKGSSGSSKGDSSGGSG